MTATETTATETQESEKPAPDSSKRPADQNQMNNAQNHKAKPEVTQGRKLVFELPCPWPHPVNGASILDRISETFTDYLSLPPGAADVLTLWAAAAHSFESFGIFPRLNLSSPEKGCGKSTTLLVLEQFLLKPLKAENITAAVLFRVVEAHRPTLLVDEVDSFLKDNEELRGILNAGNMKGGSVLRCVGDNHEPASFNVFCPVVLAGIGALPVTLTDRSLVITLSRKRHGEQKRRWNRRDLKGEVRLMEELYRWTTDTRPQVEACKPTLPEGCDNRQEDNWLPLFTVAKVAGGDWPKRIQRAYTCLVEQNAGQGLGRSVELLADIRTAFHETGEQELASQRICEILGQREDRSWPEYRHGQPITPVQLARLLKSFRITPRNIRPGYNQDVLKGYLLSEFHEPWSRYLPTLPLSPLK